MPLTTLELRNAKPGETNQKLSDGGGLYLLVKPNGGRYWRLKYRFGGKEKLLAIGVFPETSLSAAREKREDARRLLASGVDPGAERKEEKRLQVFKSQNTFAAIGREWWEARKGAWSKSHTSATLNRLEKQLFPSLGTIPIADIEAPLLLDTIRTIEKRGALEVASKSLEVAGQVFRYAITTGRASRDPSRDLRGALQSREVRHYKALKESELPEFLEKLDAYDGNKLTQLAMRFLMLTFVRTGEMRGATWNEFDIEKAEWRIPAERMKMGAEHIVPLSRQALEVLDALRPLSGTREHLFPNEHDPRKFMSENTVLFALYRMGYRGRATGHGFRATASTILNEHGFRPDVIERQLAHAERNKIRAAYHRSEYLPDRRKMMQHWADFLDAQRTDGKVLPMRRAG